MKLTTILVLFLTLSQIYLSVAGRVSLHSSRFHRNRVRNTRRAPNQNKWFRLVMGVIGEIAGGNHEGIQACLPESWRIENQAAQGGEGEATQVTSSGGIFEKIMSIVGPIIDMFCKVKGWIKGMLGMKLAHRYGLRRAFVLRYARRRWGFFNKIGNAFKKVGQGIKNVAQKVGQGIVKAANVVKDTAIKVGTKIKEGAEWLINKAKEAVMAVIGKIKEWWGKLVQKVKDIFNSPIVQGIINFLACLPSIASSLKEAFDVIKGIVTKIRNIIASGLVGLVDVLLDLICNWREFKAAVDYLIAAIKQSDTLEKFYLIGKFIGKLLYAIGKARRLRKYYYRMKLLKLRRH